MAPASVSTHIPDFFSSGLVYGLRAVLLTSLAGLIFLPFVPSNDKQIIWVVPIYTFLIVHRLFTARSITLVLALANFPICLAELTVLILHQCLVIATDRWSSQITVAFAAVSWILMFLVGIEIGARFWVFLTNFPATKLRTDCFAFTVPDRLIQRFPGFRAILFGRSIWKGHFVGERAATRRTRGVSAAVIFGILTYAVALNFILLPARETGLVTVKETRSLSLPHDFAADTTVWNVVLTRDASHDDPSTNWDNIFHSAVQVIPLWDNSSTLAPPCVHLPGSIKIADPQTPICQAITIHCPSRSSNITDTPLGALSLPYQDGQPDLLIVVNYTTLGVSPDSIIDMRRSSITVRVGLDNNTDKVVHRTAPFTILPGMNLVSTLTLEIRQLFVYPAVSSIGFFDAVDTFFVTRMRSLGPDPRAEISTTVAIPRAPEISTLRTFAMIDSSERLFIQDNREHSIVNGFSQLGGLWTFTSGIFSLAFGMSLMRIIFGVKPISVFGLAHLLERKKIIEAFAEEYPRIQEEMAVPKHERGIADLLRDHLIDLDLFEERADEKVDLEKNVRREGVRGAEPQMVVEPPIIPSVNTLGGHATDRSRTI